MVDGRRPSVEDNLQWKTTFGGRWLSVEDNFWWKTTFSGRRPWVESCMLPTPLCGIFVGCFTKTPRLGSRNKESFSISAIIVDLFTTCHPTTSYSFLITLSPESHKTHSQIKWDMRLQNVKKIQINIFWALLYHIDRGTSF